MWQKKSLIILTIIFIVALVVLCVVLFDQNVKQQKVLQQNQLLIARGILNRQALDFLRAFVDKVLRANGEVSFNDRLQLENMVRNLKDDAVLAEWNKFVNSQTPAEAQDEVKNLLELLVRKIQA